MDRPGGADRVVRPQLGSSFGHYRIDGILGRGGMGVVFQATDLRLDRPVALKVLAAELAVDPAFQERFRRESRLAAAIEHPAILPVYEADSVGGTLFIAMRIASGGDLAGLLRREAPLAIKRALSILQPVADALDAAHQEGLVHRDVKAANILLEPRGGTELAYIADFGLTRRVGPVASHPTAPGLAGSIDTISPEQIAGGVVGAPADQYALACVAFQCLTGFAPFTGESDAATLYAHLHAAMPSVAAVSAWTHGRSMGTAVDTVLRRALAKRPADRWPDCGTFVAALGQAAGLAAPGRVVDRRTSGRALTESTSRSAARSRRALGPWFAAAAGAGALTLLGVGVIGGLLASVASTPGTSGPALTMPATAGSSAPIEGQGGASADPEGLGPGSTEGARELPGASPAPQDVPGVIVFTGIGTTDSGRDLYRIGPDGFGNAPITTDRGDETSPAVSEDGRWLAFAVGGIGDRDLWIMDLVTGGRTQLTDGPGDDTDPAWSPDGAWLSFSRSGQAQMDLWIVPMDGGMSIGVEEPLVATPADERSSAWSPDGVTLAYTTNGPDGRRVHLIAVDEPGVSTILAPGTTTDDEPSWLPNGAMVVTREQQGDLDIFIVDDPLGSAPAHQLTTSNLADANANSSPDGSAIVYAHGRSIEDGMADLFLHSVDGGLPIPLTVADLLPRDPVWARSP